MGTDRAQSFVQGYLQRARGNHALEASVLAAGGRLGHSERRLRRAARLLGVEIDRHTQSWILPAQAVLTPEPSALRVGPAPSALGVRTHGLA